MSDTLIQKSPKIPHLNNLGEGVYSSFFLDKKKRYKQTQIQKNNHLGVSNIWVKKEEKIYRGKKEAIKSSFW